MRIWKIQMKFNALTTYNAIYFWTSWVIHVTHIPKINGHFCYGTNLLSLCLGIRSVNIHDLSTLACLNVYNWAFVLSLFLLSKEKKMWTESKFQVGWLPICATTRIAYGKIYFNLFVVIALHRNVSIAFIFVYSVTSKQSRSFTKSEIYMRSK